MSMKIFVLESIMLIIFWSPPAIAIAILTVGIVKKNKPIIITALIAIIPVLLFMLYIIAQSSFGQ